MKNLILLEHFTAQSDINHNQDKDILREALNIANTIIRNFIKNPDIKKLFVIRNEKFKKIISNKVIFLSTNQLTSSKPLHHLHLNKISRLGYLWTKL